MTVGVPSVAQSQARPRVRLVVGTVVLLVALALLVAQSRSAQSAPELPQVDADELLASVIRAGAEASPVSGEATVSLDLGLPDLASHGGRDDPLADLAGEKRLRVWRSPDGVRVAQLEEMSEKVLVTDGEQAWTWDSATMTATRSPVDRAHGGSGAGVAHLDVLGAVQNGLAALEQEASVTVTGTARIAGRDAYRVQLIPDTDGTLVGRLELDIDAIERVPLRAAIFAAGAHAAAVEGAYTSVSFAPVDPATFSFTPPPGAEIVEALDHEAENRTGDSQSPEVRHFGEDWEKVTAVAVPDRGNDGERTLDRLLPFEGSLFSARSVEADGRTWILLGAVPGERLEAAADSLR